MHETVTDKKKEGRGELAAFLKSMRARIRPEEVGLAPGTRRRVTGLRREEVARLASISNTWYVWLEQGRDVTPSESALERLARALRLSHVEQAHLLRLARPANGQTETDRFTARAPSPALRAFVVGLHPNPAYVLDPLWNIAAWNEAAGRLLGDFPAANGENHDPASRNLLGRMFLDENWRRLFQGWNTLATSAVAQFRAATSELRNYPEHRQIVDTLRKRSPKFSALWEKIELAEPRNWRKTICHPVAGRITFNYATLACSGDDRGFWISIYTPDTDSDRSALNTLFHSP